MGNASLYDVQYGYCLIIGNDNPWCRPYEENYKNSFNTATVVCLKRQKAELSDRKRIFIF